MKNLMLRSSKDINITNEDGNLLAVVKDDNKELAAYICKAVNNHAALLQCAEILFDLCGNWEEHKVHDIKYWEVLNHDLTSNKSMLEYCKSTLTTAQR